jgi:hypothetical protein
MGHPAVRDGVRRHLAGMFAAPKTAGEMSAVKPARRRRYPPSERSSRRLIVFLMEHCGSFGKIMRSIRLGNPTLTSQRTRG